MAFVAEHGSHRTPALFNVATLWSALEGSILLWVLFCGLSGPGRAPVPGPTGRSDGRLDPVGHVHGLRLLLLPAGRPSAAIRPVRAVGRLRRAWPQPLLQNHVLMAFHPPVLYLGFRRVHRALRPGGGLPGHWSPRGGLAAGGSSVDAGRLGLPDGGIILGAWWSYDVLGWGGFWAWDPVEKPRSCPG
ncbi:MAG: hypothetical protein Ct9H300mP12_15450 [Acidimicrobiales bacterium]|nr:MAG: hypothetical protein Ct9H300mP12_15450 [Acidimicrobiales bacterium]